MDSFYRLCGECLVAADGRIVKYIGDGILAVFPEDAADRAVAAGACMRKEYATLVSAQQTNVDSDLEVGISYGRVEEGIVGHPTLRTFDLFGECVNEAATICHHRGIAITDAVRVRLSKETTVQALEPYRPKWRSDPLIVWEIC
jgi:class 3 adenylate cyclase